MSGELVQRIWYQAGDFEMELQQPLALCYAASLKTKITGCEEHADHLSGYFTLFGHLILLMEKTKTGPKGFGWKWAGMPYLAWA